MVPSVPETMAVLIVKIDNPYKCDSTGLTEQEDFSERGPA